MAVSHYQFEAKHPFYDSNGRTGRSLNVLYLIERGLLTLPILYLSRYIVQNKADYYRLLNQVAREQVWEPLSADHAQGRRTDVQLDVQQNPDDQGIDCHDIRIYQG